MHNMVDDHDKRVRTEINRKCYTDAGYDSKQATVNRQVQHSLAVDHVVRLGLQRFQNAYESKKARRSIPPGWRDVAHTGLKDALREAGEIAVKRAAVGLGRPVDPENSNAELGTANMAFAHKQELVASDMTPFGHWRAFLMHLFSAGVHIAGSDVKLMLEIWVHAFEPFQEVSFFFLMCGGPGTHVRTRTFTPLGGFTNLPVSTTFYFDRRRQEHAGQAHDGAPLRGLDQGLGL